MKYLSYRYLLLYICRIEIDTSKISSLVFTAKYENNYVLWAYCIATFDSNFRIIPVPLTNKCAEREKDR
jgi:hypothetical protein